VFTNYDLEIFSRLVLSLILSSLVGLERELHRRTAGLRTHILVSMGSCLIMLTSLHVFAIYKGQVPLDPTRIAAGVITGIGFLGAGTIMRDRAGVKGLTTAASLWVVAAVGLAVGCGFYSAAIFSTLLTLAVLMILRIFEGIILDSDEQRAKTKQK
jgi:putative Mg2+ transporter-C (MgtC) family protein